MEMRPEIMSLKDTLNKKYKKDVVFSAKTMPHRPKYRIPFTSPTLNRLTGGGIMVPRMSMVYGPSSVFKSTAAYDIIAQAQRLRAEKPKLTGGREIVLVDTEKSADETYLKQCGVDTSPGALLIVDDFTNGDELVDIMVDICKSDKAMLIVMDSLTTLLSKREDETDTENLIKLQGWNGKFTSGMFKKLHAAMRGNTAIMFTNQIRDTLGDRMDRARNNQVGYTPTGGHSPKFYSTDILEFKHASAEHADQYDDIPAPTKTGKMQRKKFESWVISARVEKTRSTGNDNMELFFKYLPNEARVDRIGEVFNLAQMDGIITNKGAFYYYKVPGMKEAERLGQGKVGVRKALLTETDIYEKILEAIERKSRILGGADEPIPSTPKAKTKKSTVKKKGKK